MVKPRNRRLIQGRDFHAWAWKCTDKCNCGLEDNAQPYRGRTLPGGRWVRVRFVEVKP